MQGRSVLGQRLARVDGLEKVTGETQYGADVKLPGMLHGKILRSPHPHARLKRIDYSKALSLPGVVAVVTAEDAKRGMKSDLGASGGSLNRGHGEGQAASKERPNASRAVFADGKVLWVGQAVAAVAAASVDVAEEALRHIEVDYEVLPAVLDAEEAMKPDAPLLHPNLFTETLAYKPTQPSNVATHLELSRGDVARGFQDCDVIIEDTYRTSMIHQGYVEPRATLAKVDPDGNVTVWSSSQGMFETQKQLSQVLGIPLGSINVIPLEIGGGFGSKSQAVLEPVAILLGLKTGKPVKMVMSRGEEFQAGRPVSPMVVYLRMGVTRDGRLVAADTKIITDGGAFPGGPLTTATTYGLGYYKIPNLHIEGYDVVTNKPAVGSYRGPGAPQIVFAVESHMDRLADAIGMSPLDIRLKNIAEEGDELPTGVALPRVGFRETLEAVRDHPAWKKRASGRYTGRGLACGMWIGGRQPTSATVKVNPDGTLTLVSGVIDLTGTRTSYVQMVAEEFGVSYQEVNISVPDTNSAPYSSGTWGSKTTYTGSIAIKSACDQVKQELIRRAVPLLDLPEDQIEYRPYRLQSKQDAGRSVSLTSLASASVSTGAGPIIKTGIAPPLPMAPNFSAHLVDVEVDPETGKVRIISYAMFQDCGRAINPTLIEGQMQGAVGQGIGWALWEEYVFNDGSMKNPTWLDYRMPTTLDVPLVNTVLVEVPHPVGPYGVKGVAEASLVPSMAAIGNAIAKATRTRLTELPMTPERIFFAMKK